MERKTKTIDLKGKEYAQVKDRLMEFRTDNTNGSIETTPTFQPDGQILFKARIIRDRSDESSAEATGHALGKNSGDKAFEKLETIAVGRALALLGYASSGEIASSEEMEEFDEWKQEQHRESVLEWQEKLVDCKDLTQLKSLWSDMPVDVKKSLEDQKNELKTRLENPQEVVPETPRKRTRKVISNETSYEGA